MENALHELTDAECEELVILSGSRNENACVSYIMKRFRGTQNPNFVKIKVKECLAKLNKVCNYAGPDVENTIMNELPILGQKKGYFISFEGADGAGKGTQIDLLKQALEKTGFIVNVIRAPGGSDIGEKIRKIVVDPKNKMTPQTELMLMCAANGQSAHESIKPALDRGEIVIADRYYFSTIIYQCFGRQLDNTFVKAAIQFSIGGIVQDLTFCLYFDEAEAKKRKEKRGGTDRFEQEDAAFQDRVHAGYDWLRKLEPLSKGKVISINAKDTIEAIHTEIYKCVAARISELKPGQLELAGKLILPS